MDQQASDVPKFVQILRRYRALIGLMAALGLLAGAVFAVLNPPVFTSQALVIFPASDCPAGAICGGPLLRPTGRPTLAPSCSSPFRVESR